MLRAHLKRELMTTSESGASPSSQAGAGIDRNTIFFQASELCGESGIGGQCTTWLRRANKTYKAYVTYRCLAHACAFAGGLDAFVDEGQDFGDCGEGIAGDEVAGLALFIERAGERWVFDDRNF